MDFQIKNGVLLKYSGQDTEVIIPEGVTKIGEWAFRSCYHLASITLPEGVTKIDDGAFWFCDNLSSITLPEGLTEIGTFAFEHCTSLTDITLPASLRQIHEDAFDVNTQVTIHAPAGSYAAQWAKEHGLEPGGSGLWIENGVLRRYAGKEAQVIVPEGVTTIGDSAFYSRKALRSVTLPETVTKIGESAFWGCEKLSSINLPAGVTQIGDKAFKYCSSLMDITLPASVTEIGPDAFLNTPVTIYAPVGSYAAQWVKEHGLEPGGSGLWIENGVLRRYAGKEAQVSIPEGVTSIGDKAFRFCKNLTSITIPETVTAIGNSAFEYCGNLRSITLPAGLIEIGVEAFLSCKRLTSITIPEGVTQIVNNTFLYCGNLKDVWLPASVTKIGKNAFLYTPAAVHAPADSYAAQWAQEHGRQVVMYTNQQEEKISTFRVKNGVLVEYTGKDEVVTIPDGVREIGVKAFCTAGFRSVTIPESVTAIGAAAFFGCTLTSITIPKNVTKIGNNAFGLCTSLASVTLPAGLTEISDSAFSSCVSLTSIAIPEGVRSIGDQAFGFCEKLVGITLPEGVTKIGNKAFVGCVKLKVARLPASVTHIGVDAFKFAPVTIYAPAGSYAAQWAQEYGLRVAADTDQQEADSCEFQDEEVTAHDGGQGIENFHLRNLPRLDLASISDADADAIRHILGSLHFPGSSHLVRWAQENGLRIDADTNQQAESSGDFRIVNGVLVKYSGKDAEVTVPDGVTKIGDLAFSGCESLTSIVIPEGCNDLGYAIFDGCKHLTDIHLPASLSEIKEDALRSCRYISATIHAPADSYAARWAKKRGLEPGGSGLWIENGVLRRYAGKEAQVIVPEGITAIGNRAFAGCDSLTDIILPASVCQIAQSAFNDGNENTLPITIHAPAGSYAAQWAQGTDVQLVIENVYPDGQHFRIENGVLVKYIGEDTEITIPNNVTEIGKEAFYGCDSFRSITLPEGITKIGNVAFAFCKSLTDITLPEGLTEIGKGTFGWCKSLTDITLPASVTKIGEGAFLSTPVTIHAPADSFAAQWAEENGVKLVTEE